MINPLLLLTGKNKYRLIMTSLTSALSLPLIAFGQLAPADSGLLYGSGGYYSDGVLATIDKDSGDATIIGETGLNRVQGIAISSTGQIIGHRSDYLYRIDADSADTQQIGAVVIDSLFEDEYLDRVLAIAFNHLDELYAIFEIHDGYYYDKIVSSSKTGGNGSNYNRRFLGKIELDTSSAVVTWAIEIRPEQYRGMTFDPADGNIYASTNDGKILIINPLNGESLLLNETNLVNENWGNGISDIAFDDEGDLYASYRGPNDETFSIASIDKMDGTADSVGNTGLQSLSGLASRTYPLTGPQIGVFPVIDYGTRGINTQTTKQLLIWNPGTENLSVSNITMPLPEDQFYMESVAYPLIVEAGSYAAIDIKFWPSSEDDFLSEVTISSNDSDDPMKTVSLWGASSLIPSGVLFASDPRTGAFWMDPAGEADSLGMAEFGNSSIYGITEIEFRADGTLFFTIGDREMHVFTINPLSGEAEYVGMYHDYGDVNGLDFGANGVLYGAFADDYNSDSSSLVIVDQHDASLDFIGNTGYTHIRGLSFADDGTLYGVGPDTVNGDSTDILMTIDTATGAATKIGQTGFIKIGSIEFGPDGVLYGGIGAGYFNDVQVDSAHEGGIISINTTTGEGTFLAQTGMEAISGLSFFPEIPVIINNIKDKIYNNPKGFFLAQNYPNPFNPTTKINFKLDKPGLVTLNVYNIAGQLVETLLSENIERGTHSYNWNASHLASGLYFYKLKAGSVTLVKKAILIK